MGDSTVELTDFPARSDPALADFPLHRIPAAKFREKMSEFYPPEVAYPRDNRAHSHHLYRRVALDFGLPALVARRGPIFELRTCKLGK